MGGVAIITADHGNADEMYDVDKKTGLPKTNKDGSIKAKTSHTLNPVPCILYDNVTGGRLSLKEGSWGLSNLAAENQRKKPAFGGLFVWQKIKFLTICIDLMYLQLYI